MWVRMEDITKRRLEKQGVNMWSGLKYLWKYALASFVITAMNLGIRNNKSLNQMNY
jgi:hypothetical protein